MDGKITEIGKVVGLILTAAALFTTAFDGYQTRLLTKRLETRTVSAKIDEGEVNGAILRLKETFPGMSSHEKEQELSLEEATKIHQSRNDPTCSSYRVRNDIMTLLNYLEDVCYMYKMDALDRQYVRQVLGLLIWRYHKYFKSFIRVTSEHWGKEEWAVVDEVASEIAIANGLK